MAWPNTRLTTYTPASALKSNDLNSMQDAIIAGQHGDRVLNLPIHGAVPSNPATDNISYGDPDINIGSSGTAIKLGIPLRQGDRIKSVTFTHLGNGVATLSAGVTKISATAVTSNLGSTVITPTNGVYSSTTIDLADTILGAGEACVFIFTGTGASVIRVSNVRVTYDHP